MIIRFCLYRGLRPPGADKPPNDGDRKPRMGGVGNFNGDRFLEGLAEIRRVEFQVAFDALSRVNHFGNFDLEIFRRTVDQSHVQRLIGNVGYFEFSFVDLDRIGPRNGQPIGDNRDRIGRVGVFHDGRPYGYAAGRWSLVGFDQGAFGLQTAMASGGVDDFKRSAVTDSKLLLIERSLGASSPRLDVENLEAVVADRFDPERMGNF